MQSIDDRLRVLPPLVHVSEHAGLLCAAFGGLSRSSLYRALQSGQLGVRPIRVGGKEKPRLFLRRADVLEVLGIPAEPPGWVVPPQHHRQPDPGELLQTSPAPVVASDGQDGPSQLRCGAPADEAARVWSEALR